MTKIFCIYYKKAPLFKSEIVEPIQAGSACTSLRLPMLQDDSGENISAKNLYWGELTAWYWLLKNYLPQHPEIDTVGFCHYRRFFDFTKPSPPKRRMFKETASLRLIRSLLNPHNLDELLTQYDCIAPKKGTLNGTLVEHYGEFHDVQTLETCAAVIREKFPAYAPALEEVLKSDHLYICLNFVMRRKDFENLAQWLFEVLFEVERRIDFTAYKGYQVRTPVFLAEYFINVWLIHYRFRMCDRLAYMLIPKSQWLKTKFVQNTRWLTRLFKRRPR